MFLRFKAGVQDILMYSVLACSRFDYRDNHAKGWRAKHVLATAWFPTENQRKIQARYEDNAS